MHHQSRRLVDDDDVRVLEHDLKCDILALWFGFLRQRHRYGIAEARFDPLPCLPYRPAAGGDRARLDQRLDARTAEFGDLHGKPTIDALAGILFAGEEFPKRFAQSRLTFIYLLAATRGMHLMTTSDAGSGAGPQKTQGSGSPSVEPSWINHPRTVKRLQILVVVLGVILVGGFFAVLARVAYLATQYGTGPTTAAPAVTAPVVPGGVASPAADPGTEKLIDLPQGAAVVGVMPTRDGFVLVHFKDPKGDGLILFEPDSGTIKRRWRIAPAN